MSEDSNQINRDATGKFLPGISGNPKGRPPGKTMKEFVREFLLNMTDEQKTEWLKNIPDEVKWKMAEGLPRQEQEISGGLTVNIIDYKE